VCQDAPLHMGWELCRLRHRLHHAQAIVGTERLSEN
jgi:hypothetical protein